MSFFNRVRFYDDTKRQTFAFPTLAREGHLWLHGYPAPCILIMHRRKRNSFSHAGCKGSETLKWFLWLALTRRDSPLAYCLVWSIYSRMAMFRKTYSTWEQRDKYPATAPSRLPNNSIGLRKAWGSRDLLQLRAQQNMNLKLLFHSIHFKNPAASCIQGNALNCSIFEIRVYTY